MTITNRFGLLLALALVPAAACAHPTMHPVPQLPWGMQVELLD